MRKAWRTVAGGLCGVTAAVIWAVSIAVYQQMMEPTGFFTDPSTGRHYPNLASNNTYWPREIRHLAIVLAFAGVAVICRARCRGLAAGAVGSMVWLGADLWLDRVDVDGRTAAWLLAAAGIVGFAATAGAAARLSAGRPDTPRARYLAAGTLPVMAALVLVITTPWDEPVTNPDAVRIEDGLTVLKVGLVAMFLLAMVALLAGDLTRAGGWRVAALLAVTVVAAGWSISTNSLAGVVLGSMLLFAAGSMALPAARDVRGFRLFVVALTTVAMAPLALTLVVVGGVFVGSVMTSIAGNPEVNGADSDLSYGLPGLLVGLLVAGAVQIVAAAGPETGPRPAPAVADS